MSMIDPAKNVCRVEDNLLLGNITEYEICNIVNKLKGKFSSGIDGVSNEFLKKIINSIKFPLCVIFNKSLNEGIFPSGMKLTKIHAL